MKTSINVEKWEKVKGKFRASFLVVKAIAAIINYEIENFYFHTTYESVNLLEGRLPLGEKLKNPENEWNGNKFYFDEECIVVFKEHEPIKMTRNNDNILVRA